MEFELALYKALTHYLIGVIVLIAVYEFITEWIRSK